MDALDIWSRTLKSLKSQVSPINFRGWFSKVQPTEIIGNKIILSVPSAFYSDHLTKRYLPLILSVLKETSGADLEIGFRVDSSKPVNKASETEEDFFQFENPVYTATPILNPKYTLENFVVGLSNNVAFAAAQAVVQNPGTVYNPLFFYGGTGVGKTHLMLGIGNALLTKNPNLKVIYCSSENFMNDYIEGIQKHTTAQIRSKYRSVDILLIDDIQFFSGRDSTQEEFFHTFNELQSKNAQIVLTSDRAPGDIAKLEDRLKSRFAGGLMLDIQTPDFDTRVAILKEKCLEKGVELSEEALRLIASSLDSNIREVEGKLSQIIQTLQAQNLPPTVENVSSFLGTAVSPSIKYDQKKIFSTICTYFNIDQKDLVGPKRQKGLVLPRHFTMFLLCVELQFTVERAGQVLGGRDHTTVMHGRDRIKNLLSTDHEIQRILIEIKGQLAQ